MNLDNAYLLLRLATDPKAIQNEVLLHLSEALTEIQRLRGENETLLRYKQLVEQHSAAVKARQGAQAQAGVQ